MRFESAFDFRDRVTIDGDGSLIATVTGFFFREGMLLVECCWLANGDSRQANIEEWRLTLYKRA
jgi:hypothetical protein